MPKVEVRPVVLAARDGHPLAAKVYVPTSGPPERVVIVAPATGVKQAFYEPYARYLAVSGCAVVTFDFRGIGESLKAPIANVRATIRDWGEKDYPAIVDFARAEVPGKSVQIVGHSVGGQLVGLLENADRVDAVCTVASQHGYWRLFPTREALVFAFLWHVVMPLASYLFGYFPSKKFGLGEDLPKGVALEWARFCRSPHYFVDPAGKPLRTGFRKYTGPLVAYSFVDDERAPERCVRALHEYFENTTVEHRRVDPRATTANRIGHVGFFFSKFKDSLWRESLDWLRANGR